MSCHLKRSEISIDNHDRYLKYILHVSTACVNGTYGLDCNKTCGHCREVHQCFHADGVCLTGCDIGYQGSFCQTRMLN